MNGRIYKCYNCTDDRQVPGRDFLAEKPVCPACGLDGANPRYAHLVVKCRTIHFEGPDPIATGRGCGALACGAKYQGVMATGIPDVANCPACRKTEAWKATKAAHDSSPDDIELPDVPTVQIDAVNQQYVKGEA